MKKYMSPGTFQQRPRSTGSLYIPEKLQSPYGSVMNGGDMVPLSPADPKPRLRWTPELHERFVDAVTQLGGADSTSININLSPSTEILNFPPNTNQPSRILSLKP